MKPQGGLFMDTEYSKAEFDALEEKALNPDKSVVCPRCGKELQFRRVGNSYEVKCPTAGCIIETCRGL